MRTLTTFLLVLAITTLAGVGGFFVLHFIGARALAASAGLIFVASALAVFTAWFLRE
jgi:hypothetical protein